MAFWLVRPQRWFGWWSGPPVPSLLQMDLVECGATCLAMVLAFHGRWEPTEELRRRCDVSRDGSSARSLLTAARSYGIRAEAYRRDHDELLDLRFPFIAFWDSRHFVVVTSIRDDKIYVNDPAVGRRVLARADFRKHYSGIALTFEPTDQFEPGGMPPSFARASRQWLAPAKMGFAYIVIVTAMLILPSIVMPAMMKIFVDQYLVLGLTTWMRPLLLAMGIGCTAVGIMTWLQQRYLLRLQIALSVKWTRDVFLKLLALPPEYFTQRTAADLNGRLQSVSRTAYTLSRGMSANLIGCICIIAYGAAMAMYSVRLSIIPAIYALMSTFAARWFYTRRQDGSRLLAKVQARVVALAVNGLQNIETVKATGSERDLFGQWSGAQAQFISIHQKISSDAAKTTAVPAMLSGLGSALILVFGAEEVIAGRMTIGDLVSFQMLFAAFSAPLQSLVGLFTTLPQTTADMSRIDDILDAPRLACAPGHGSRPTKPSGLIELKGVTFGYSRHSGPTVRDINLRLEAGGRLAIVGSSGGGKSTLIRLISGLYTPWEGQILLDGVPIGEIDPIVRASAIGLVDQEIVFFGSSVRENLTLWNGDIHDEVIAAALADAEMADVIATRSHGIDSPLIEGARNFSGGERQRLELARALVGDPSLLLLDEATSALDPVVEKKIDDNLRRRGCSCIVSAHRLSTVRDCDEIVVLERGQIVQRGQHEDLLRQGGTYGRLIRAQ